MSKLGKIAVLGAGKLGQTLIRGLLDRRIVAARDVTATTRHAATAAAVRKALGVLTMIDNVAAIRGARTILVAVKPPAAEALLREIGPALKAGPCVISTVAAVTTASMESWLGGKPAVIRTMPNTPCLIGEGMTGIAAGRHASR